MGINILCIILKCLEINVSVIWDYFEKINDVDKKAKCRVCGDLYKGSTGNLKTHLKKRHLDAYTRVITAQLAKSAPQAVPTALPVSVVATSTTTAAAICTTGEPSTSTFTPKTAMSSTSIVRHQIQKQYTMERYGTAKKNIR
ncbi:unnamed protein product [Parnassius apollo]|uniref:(apollo) hypothetical protein n=1 Tax=Parnassius apollo TaxID=110799 RepID=A0A8S3VZR3_PARAO|nr:unnamed protein product [Parnassius apollo]